MTSVAFDVTARYNAFESWFYDRYLAPAVVSLAAPVAKELLDAMPLGARVLDVGCGGGQLACLVAERRRDLSVVGVDLSPEQIGRARRRGKPLADRLSFVEGSALALPFADATFDAVYSVASIKHWPDQRRGIAECVRVLRPGGLLLVVEADRGCRLDDARRFVGDFRVPAPLRHVALPAFRTWVAGQALDLDDARRLTEGLPLEPADVRRIEHTPGLWIKAARAR